MPEPTQPGREVIYGVLSDPYGNHEGEWAVFALREDAECNIRLREALKKAKSWGQFREMVDPDTFARAIEYCSAYFDFQEWCGFEDLDPDSAEVRSRYAAEPLGQRKPIDDDPFDPQQISAYRDGDYPGGLGWTTDAWMPEAVSKKYATLDATMGGGAGLCFDPAQCEEIADALRRHGFVVSEEGGLVFDAQFGDD